MKTERMSLTRSIGLYASSMVLGIGVLCNPLSAWAQGKEPVRIGALSSQSGVFTEAGAYILKGIQYAVDEANAKGGIDGRKVELRIADDESTPEGGRRAGEKLAREGHNLLVGPIASSISLALVANLDRWDALYMDVSAKADKLAGDSCKPRYFRSNHSDSMEFAMVTEWAKSFKEQKYGIVASDYIWGRNSGESFARAVKNQGKTVAVELYTPLGTKDFAPYISQLSAANAEVIWVAEAGRDALNFVKQSKDFGLMSKSRIIGQVLITDYTIKATGDALNGVSGIIGWVSDIDTPMNKAFVSGWKAKYNGLPADYHAQAYNGMQVLFEGIRKAGSVKPVDVAKALKGATMDSIYGTVTMRAQDHQLVLPGYIGKVQMVNGEYRSTLERTFPVSIVPPPSPLCKM